MHIRCNQGVKWAFTILTLVVRQENTDMAGPHMNDFRECLSAGEEEKELEYLRCKIVAEKTS